MYIVAIAGDQSAVEVDDLQLGSAKRGVIADNFSTSVVSFAGSTNEQKNICKRCTDPVRDVRAGQDR